MKKSTLLTSFIAIATLVGCGGGSSNNTPTTITGQFQDTYVFGLNYKCSSNKEGITNLKGEYTCNIGDNVTFSLGSYTLGTAKAAKTITPKTLYPDNQDAELNVAQLLQSLDTGNNSGVITISKNFNALDDVNIPPTDTEFDTKMAQKLQSLETPKQLISEEQAKEHLQNSYTNILKELLQGKTLYQAFSDGFLSKSTFNADASSVTWVELDDEGCHGVANLTFDGMNINFTSISDSCSPQDVGNQGTIIISKINDDYLLATSEEDGTSRFYFDKTKAQEYLDSLTQNSPNNSLKNILKGKTLYQVFSDGSMSKSTFNADASSVTWVELDEAGCHGAANITIDGMNINFTSTSDNCFPQDIGSQGTIIISKINNDYLLASDEEDETSRFYFDKTKAQEYASTLYK